MAQLTTPSISSLAFVTASRVDGLATYGTGASNNNDVDQMRVRWVRSTSTSTSPAASTVRGLAERSSSSFASFTSSGRSYQYKDETIRSGLDGSLSISESSLSGYNVWAMVRLEV